MGDLNTTKVFVSDGEYNEDDLNAISSSLTIKDGVVNEAKLATGAVTATKIAARAVSFGKMQSVSEGVILGRSSSGSGDIEAVEANGARSLLGLSSTATSTCLVAASNLSDLASASTARTNLGLGDSATKNTGTAAGTVAAGDDSRITGAVQTAGSGLEKSGTTLSLKTPIVKAYNSTTQAITANTDTVLSFNSEEVDTDSWFNVSNGRFQPSIACWCKLSARATVAQGNLYSKRAVWIAKNGTTTQDQDQFYSGRLDDAISGFVYTPKSEALVYFNGTTDYAQVYFRANTACTLIADSWGTRFEAEMVRVA